MGSCLISYFFFTPLPWCLLIIKINQTRSRRKEEETQCVHESKQWEACFEMAPHGAFPLSTPTLLDATLFNATLCYATLVLIFNVNISYLVFWYLYPWGSIKISTSPKWWCWTEQPKTHRCHFETNIGCRWNSSNMSTRKVACPVGGETTGQVNKDSYSIPLNVTFCFPV